MEFLAPLMLLGALGAAVPIAIHLIGRRKAPVVRFAAMDFLLSSDKKVARRLRLRELLLLAVRVLVCMAIPLALAKPFTACQTDGPQVARGPQAAVIIIDNSLASTYEIDGQTLLSRAQTRARQVLDQMGPEADVTIALTAEGSNPPDELARDHLQLRDRIAAITSSARPADTASALGRAARLLSQSNQQRKTIFLLSPLTAAGFRGDSLDPTLSGVDITVIDVSEGRALENAAVVAVDISPDPNAGSRGVRVAADIANFGTRAIDDRAVRLRIGERVIATGTVSLRPGERATKRFAAALPEGRRIADVSVELDEDALPLDDRRYVRAQLRAQVRTLLVNGDPRTVRHDDETFYLESALRPGDRAESGVSVSTTTAEELGEVDLALYDVVVLANTRALEANVVVALAKWVNAGGGLFITVGENVNADAYNQTMAPLLPQQLRDPVEAAYGTSGAERAGRALRLTKLEAAHPILSVFDEHASGIGDAQFYKVTLLGPTTKVSDRRVLARFSNGSGALIEATSGRGRLLLLASSIDRDWNDLAIHPGYLPLVQRSVRYLARKQDDARKASVLVGRRHPIAIPGDATRVEITGPANRRTLIEGTRVAGRDSISYAETDAPGFYRVSIATTGKARPQPEAHFAVNLDPLASDVRKAGTAGTAPATEQVASLTDGAASAKHKRRVELWHAIAAALLAFLLFESILIARS